MKTRMLKTAFFTLFIVMCILSLATITNGQQCGSKEECQKMIDEYEKKLADTRKQKNTLFSEIEYMDTQIRLTTLKIQNTENEYKKTEGEIEALGGKIDSLNTSLDYLGKILIQKIAEGYKNRESTIFDILLNSDNASVLSKRIKYLKTAEDSDRRMAFKVQQTKFNFEEQKNLREEKKKQLESLKMTLDQQKSTLSNQKGSKQKLLDVTKNDEKTFQSLLDGLRAEYAAIQGIVSGGGSETPLRDVKKGDTIATVISGRSCNSSGTHLHFTVKEGDNVINPFNKLKNIDHVDYTGGDAWTPSGDWDWPLSAPISFNQGYGETSCVKFGICGRIYNSHNGIDVYGGSSDVHAVADGQLFKGGYSGSNGCTLNYVKLIHSGTNFVSYYLHVYSR